MRPAPATVILSMKKSAMLPASMSTSKPYFRLDHGAVAERERGKTGQGCHRAAIHTQFVLGETRTDHVDGFIYRTRLLQP